MFFSNKKATEDEPVLLGEDFDIYPDLGENSRIDCLKKAQEPQAQIEEEEYDDEPIEPTPFQQRCAQISSENWDKLQAAGGIALGSLAAFTMTFLSSIEVFANWGLLIGVVLTLFVPNRLEKLCDRSIKKLRISMIFTLITLFALYAVYIFMIKPR